MILTYTKTTEDLVFAISYLHLPIKFEIGTDFSLKFPDEEYSGVAQVLEALIELCKCDPHDLGLLNDNVVQEIFRIRKSVPGRELRKLLSTKFKENEAKEEKEPSNIPLYNYLNGERLTVADIVLFALVYKSIREGAKYTVNEKKWFDEFQKHLSQTMEFKELEMVDFEMMDIRVGKIAEIRKHPNADRLFVEQVDLGQTGKLQIVSGLVEHCTIEELQDKHCIFLISIKKDKLKGELSHGMIICASYEDKFEVLSAPVDEPGEKLYLEGNKRPVVRTFNVPKLDVKTPTFEEIFKHLKIQNHKLTYMGKNVLVDGKEIITRNIKDGNVR